MKRNLLIRTDSTAEIGIGHMMRCIALAQGWQDRGGGVIFISHCESTALKERIESEGFRFIFLDKVCPDATDLITTLNILKSESVIPPSWLVLDGYHFTSEYQKAIRDEGNNLIVIDDMNHLSSYHANIILNQNIHALDLKYHCDNDTTLLLGTPYILLRREFLKFKNFKRQIPDKARNILVTLGGSDPDNVTLKVIETLKHLEALEIEVKVIIGPANPHGEILSRALTAARFANDLLINPPNMPELMVWADMAISAGGSTCWELAFMGVPIMVLILADNQETVAEGISREGFAVNLGWYKTFDTKIISKEINSLIQSKDRRLNMVRKGQTFINATGNDHLYEKIFALSVSIKPAKESDCETIWNWANDQDVRNSAFSSDMIPFEDHKKWFHSKLNDPLSYQFIAYNGSDQPIGQIRFDEITDREYEVDISIDKRFRNKGYGTVLIKRAISKLNNHTKVDCVHSYVKFSNNHSKNLFLKAEFSPEQDTIIKNTPCLHFVWKRKQWIK